MAESIAGYSLLRVLERWGEEEFLQAHQASMHRDVLLRVLRTEHPERADAFLEVARRLAAIDHPAVARVHEAGREGAAVYCSMEYPGEETLERLLATNGRLEPARAVAIARDVLEALEQVAARGLVHGALRPRVIFLAGERAKVAGFGSVLPAAVMLLADAVQFLSPEHVSAGRLDTRSDIYSLGMILYRALSGRLPYRDIDPRSVMRRQVEEMPRPLGELAPDLPAALSAAVEKAVQKDPRLRFQEPAEMRRALQKALDAAPEKPSAPARRPPRSSRRRSRRR